MTASLPRLTVAAVEDYIPDPYFERGQSYDRNGWVFLKTRLAEPQAN